MAFAALAYACVDGSATSIDGSSGAPNDVFPTPSSTPRGGDHNADVGIRASYVTAMFLPNSAVAGGDAITLRVVTLDQNTSNLAGRKVSVTAPPGVTLSGSPGLTDAQGSVRIAVASQLSGRMKLTATVDGFTRYAEIFFAKRCPDFFMATEQNISIPTIDNVYLTSVLAGDLNGDAADDLVAMQNQNSIVALLNDGHGRFAPYGVTRVADGVTLIQGAAADLNNDGKVDVVTTASAAGPTDAGLNPNAVYLALFAGLGDGGFASPVYSSAIPISGAYMQVMVGDVDADGLMDVVAGHSGFSKDLLIGFNTASSSLTMFSYKMLHTADSPGQPVISDLNLDGLPDLLVVGLPGTLSIIFATAPRQFAPIVTLKSHATLDSNGSNPKYEAEFVSLGDFTGDALPDFISPSWTRPFMDLYQQRAGGAWVWARSYPTSETYMAYPWVADYNGDEKVDVIFGSAEDLVLFLNQGDGALSQATHIPAGRTPGRPVASDFDGDGALDVAVLANGQVSVVRNFCQ